MYNFETVIGSQTKRPLEIDTVSSEYGVYIRTDIQEYHKEDQGVEFNGWKYKEVFVPNNEYLVDKIVELVQENGELKAQNEALKEQVAEGNQTLMLGMVDLYEMNLGV